jgi:hypothetical protein
VGQLVAKGDLVACIHDTGTLTAEIMIPEKEIADVQLGQTVTLKARAFPTESFHARVVSIAPIANHDDALAAGKTILVTAQLDPSALRLRGEMTGHAKINCGKRRVLEIITRRFVRYLRVEFWSWW